jgi:hypothetical protein
MTEPKVVAWIHFFKNGGFQITPIKKYPQDFPLYFSSQQKEWQGLTDEEAKEVWKQLNYDLNHGKFAADDTERHVIVEFYRAIEAKLKEKNT